MGFQRQIPLNPPFSKGEVTPLHLNAHRARQVVPPQPFAWHGIPPFEKGGRGGICFYMVSVMP